MGNNEIVKTRGDIHSGLMLILVLKSVENVNRDLIEDNKNYMCIADGTKPSLARALTIEVIIRLI